MVINRVRQGLGLGLGCVLFGALIGACNSSSPTLSANVPDIPIYPDAELREAVVGEDLDPTEYYVVRGSDTGDVLAWYQEAMADAGWTANSDPDAEFVYYHTEEGCYGFVGVFAADEGLVELQVSQQRPGTRCYAYLTPDPSGGTD